KAGRRPEGEDRLGCEHLDTSDLDLSVDERVRIGLKLLDLFLECVPGVVSAEVHMARWKSTPQHKQRGRAKGRGSKHQLHVLVMDPEAEAWARERNAILSELDPALLPMVEPPLQWGPDSPGGYRYALRGHVPMVRAQRAPEGSLEAVYGALNRIQETPWQINRGVLEVLEELVRRGGGRAGLPHLEPSDPPARPEILDDPEAEGYVEALQAWKRAKHAWHQEENQRLSKAKALMSALTTAKRFEDAPAIWFPWNLDFRGRAYAVPTGLQPQGNDVAKGLLTFTEGSTIGSSGRRWLALHGSTCIGEWKGRKISRMTLDERVELIESLTPSIYAVDADPFTETWWMEAEYPFKTLAFCFEWAAADREGPSYLSTLPVAVDGTCNGLQHFSA
ncbi:MAG: hypothetical protein GWN18_13175, partial [Thermoplasmata archaeon]|nr:hypothetical protein [Thermoplasmata archaeon]NIS20916.1 hypothetical protein [Thermoplasmata archaeon]NIT78347.1 hypothetical protein [Thermoplasmata archaeon]NIU49970.1 hypothetical protein [Thermoplasmata archaeon]NIV79667.1 hypothetical protein [Thermoplasmata archaeon]